MGNVRKNMWDMLEGSRSGALAGRIFEPCIVALIVLNTVAVIVESVAAVQNRYGKWLTLFDTISVLIFSLEYLARVWSCAVDPRYGSSFLGRLRFLFTPFAVIDLLAVLPFYLPFLGLDLRFMRIFRVVRVLRVAKLTRYSTSFQLMGRVFRNKKEELAMALGVVVLLLIVTSSLMYFAENTAQPNKFSSIPAAMWWSIMTLTAVGYGDIYPITQLGKLLASITAMLGSAVFALPAGILGAGFVEELQKRKNKPHQCPHCGQQL